jgi:hypothetical protein
MAQAVLLNLRNWKNRLHFIKFLVRSTSRVVGKEGKAILNCQTISTGIIHLHALPFQTFPSLHPPNTILETICGVMRFVKLFSRFIFHIEFEKKYRKFIKIVLMGTIRV